LTAEAEARKGAWLHRHSRVATTANAAVADVFVDQIDECLDIFEVIMAIEGRQRLAG